MKDQDISKRGLYIPGTNQPIWVETSKGSTVLELVTQKLVEIAGTKCKKWTGQLDRYGKPTLYVDGVYYKPHHVVYHAHTGESIVQGMCIHRSTHECTVRVCMNPEHMYASSPNQHGGISRFITKRNISTIPVSMKPKVPESMVSEGKASLAFRMVNDGESFDIIEAMTGVSQRVLRQYRLAVDRAKRR